MKGCANEVAQVIGASLPWQSPSAWHTATEAHREKWCGHCRRRGDGCKACGASGPIGTSSSGGGCHHSATWRMSLCHAPFISAIARRDYSESATRACDARHSSTCTRQARSTGGAPRDAPDRQNAAATSSARARVAARRATSSVGASSRGGALPFAQRHSRRCRPRLRRAV